LRDGADVGEGIRLLEAAGAPALASRLFRLAPAANRRALEGWLRRRFGVDGERLAVRPAAGAAARPLRDEFPFLGSPGCPVELEALASRKISRYHAYVAAHARLRDSVSPEERAATCGELLDGYLENRLIWEELDHYRLHGAPLGRHPIFAEFRRRGELLKLSVKELCERRRRVEGNIWRTKSEMARGDKPHLDAIRRERLDGYRRELAEIDRLLE
jgi:hypothetical protein